MMPLVDNPIRTAGAATATGMSPGGAPEREAGATPGPATIPSNRNGRMRNRGNRSPGPQARQFQPPLRVLEATGHRGGDDPAAFLAGAAHRHAQVAGFHQAGGPLRLQVFHQAGDDPPGEPEVPIEEVLESRWRCVAAADFVDSLDPERRALVRLRFDAGLSQDDVALAMQVTRRRVRTLEQRVLTGLRRYLKRRGLV